MQIKLTLTDKDIKAIQAYLSIASEHEPGHKPTDINRLMAKLAKAVDTPTVPKASKKPKSIADLIGRPEIKKALVPAKIDTVADEKIVSYWRFDQPTTEPCKHCGKGLACARLVAADGGLIHADCRGAYMAQHSIVLNGRFAMRGTTGPDFTGPCNQSNCRLSELYPPVIGLGQQYQNAAQAIGYALAGLFLERETVEDAEAA